MAVAFANKVGLCINQATLTYDVALPSTYCGNQHCAGGYASMCCQPATQPALVQAIAYCL